MDHDIKTNDGIIETKINITTENEIVEPTVITEPINAQIVRQLEYYFSDANFPYDKFLRNLATANNGWVEINVIMHFKRLASISDDKAVITSAVKTSCSSLLEVDETNEKIRRKLDQGVPVANRKLLNELMEKSLYCNGFPKTTTLDELITFAATFGDKNIIRVIQRFINNEFQGSVYLVFRTKELAHIFLKQESVKYKELELEYMWEKDYFKSLKKNGYIQNNQNRLLIQIKEYYEPGCLLKVDIVEENVTIYDISRFCSQMNWPVAYIKLNDYNKTAWIRMKPNEVAAHVMLDLMVEDNKSPKMLFSIPKQEEEHRVLNQMFNEMSIILEKKKKKNRFKKTRLFKINKTLMLIF